MARAKTGDCAYCGKNALLTLDHVIPKCLFIPPLPGDMPKVWACAQCNNVRKSADDNYLRDLLVTDFETQNHPVAKQLFVKFRRSIARRQSEFARDATAKPGKYIDIYTPGGIFVGVGYATELPDARVIPMIQMMTRGLYYQFFNNMLPEGRQFKVHRTRDVPAMLPTVQGLVQSGVATYVPVGGGDVFNCIHAHAHNASRLYASLWFLGFYERVIYSVEVDLS